MFDVHILEQGVQGRGLSGFERVEKGLVFKKLLVNEGTLQF